MARGVDELVVAAWRGEPYVRRVDRHALVAFALQGVGEKGPFERHAAPRAHFADRLVASVRQASRIVKQAPDQGRFAVVDVPHDDDRQTFAHDGGGHYM